MKIKRDWGLVLAGGGGKGAYEIGAWKAIRERKDLKITAVSGASVGALNAALYAAGDYERAKCIWEKQVNEEVILMPGHLRKKEFLHSVEETVRENREWIMQIPSLKELTLAPGVLWKAFWKKRAVTRVVGELLDGSFAMSVALLIYHMAKKGVFTREGLIQIIRQNEILPEVRRSEISCYASCYDITEQSVTYFLMQRYSEDEILQILLASSALPFIFSPEKIGSRKYWDGGLKDNLPVRPLYDAGYRKLLVVHLSREDKDLFAEHLPFLERKCTTPEEDSVCFPGAKLVHVYPQKSLSGFRGTLDFHHKTVERIMQQGYLETKKSLEKAF